VSELRRSAAHVFVDDLELPVVGDDDRHHLARVLRLRDGEPVTISDGEGRWRPCRWTGSGVEPIGDSTTTPTSVETTVAFGVTKGDKPELVVQKLTELGVMRIVPFVASRSVSRWDENKADRNLERLRRVVREAAMQSRRCTIPVVDPLHASTAEVVRRFVGRVALAEPDGDEPTASTEVLVIGPEGGFSPDELAIAPHVALPGGILRAETAAIAAGVVLARLHGGRR